MILTFYYHRIQSYALNALSLEARARTRILLSDPWTMSYVNRPSSSVLAELQWLNLEQVIAR